MSKKFPSAPILALGLISITGLLLSACSTSLPLQEYLRIDGERLENGTPLPGWFMVTPGDRQSSVTATTLPGTVYSGRGAVRINGDFPVSKALDSPCRGIVIVDYWHYPHPGPSTNSALTLYGARKGNQFTGQFLTVHKNDQNLWWVSGITEPVARYSGQYTHIVIAVNTNTGQFGVSIDGEQVASQVMVTSPEVISQGIHNFSFNSGRGGAGTDSYIDDFVIGTTAQYQFPPASHHPPLSGPSARHSEPSSKSTPPAELDPKLKELGRECLGYIRAKEYDDAISTGRQALRISDRQDVTEALNYLIAMAYTNKGIYAFRDQNWKESIQLFKQALDYDPSFSAARVNLSAAYNNWGNEYLEDGDYRKALALYTDALNCDSTYASEISINRDLAFKGIAGEQVSRNDLRNIIIRAIIEGVAEGVTKRILR